MNNASLELGGTNWAEKDGNILGYSVGDTSGNFSPQEFTFARGSNLSATRIDRAGLIVKGRENVLLQSNQFDTTWGSINVSETGGQAGYDGTNDAWVLTDNTATDIHSLAQYGIWPNSLCTGSIYVKAGSLSKFYVSNGSSGIGVFFNLSNGSVEGVTGAVIAQSITSVGGDWYRLSVTMQSAGTFLIGAYQTFVSGNYNASINYTGTGTGTIYIQDAQIEQGLAASPYIPTTTTTAQAGVLENTPRLNYTTGVANPYLLLEPSRTNLVTYSEYFGSIFWGKYVFGGASLTRTFGYQSPEGNNNAYKFDVVVGTGGVLLTNNITINPADSQTLSVWMKGENGGEKVRLSLRNSSSAGTSAGVTTLTNEWVRYDVTLSTDAANRGFQFRMLISDGVSDQTIYVYGAQLEAGTYPTSYIPTYSVSATRAEDFCDKTNASGEINSIEGVLYAEIAALANDSDSKRITISDGTLANRITLSISDNIVSGFINVNNVTQYTFFESGQDVVNPIKIAVKYKANDFAIWINGVEYDASTSGTAFSSSTLIQLSFDNAMGANNFYGKVNALQVYKEALTDAELATLTTI